MESLAGVISLPPCTQSAKRADFLETLELPLGPGSGRPGTGWGGPWESVWCWAGSGVLETGGQIGGDSFENKSRVGFEKIIQSDRVCLGPKSFGRVFSSHREGVQAQNQGDFFFKAWHRQIGCRLARSWRPYWSLPSLPLSRQQCCIMETASEPSKLGGLHPIWRTG